MREKEAQEKVAAAAAAAAAKGEEQPHAGQPLAQHAPLADWDEPVAPRSPDGGLSKTQGPSGTQRREIEHPSFAMESPGEPVPAAAEQRPPKYSDDFSFATQTPEKAEAPPRGQKGGPPGGKVSTELSAEEQSCRVAAERGLEVNLAAEPAPDTHIAVGDKGGEGEQLGAARVAGAVPASLAAAERAPSAHSAEETAADAAQFAASWTAGSGFTAGTAVTGRIEDEDAAIGAASGAVSAASQTPAIRPLVLQDQDPASAVAYTDVKSPPAIKPWGGSPAGQADETLATASASEGGDTATSSSDLGSVEKVVQGSGDVSDEGLQGGVVAGVGGDEVC